MSKRIVIAGRGHIGGYVEHALRNAGHDVMSYDVLDGYNLADEEKARLAIVGSHVVIDTLPYTRNLLIAQLAAELGVAYFNLTEDVGNTRAIRDLADKGVSAPLVPQCGLAPGMVSIIAHQLAKSFQAVDSIAIRVGALPAQATNRLGYALTWNPAGLINEYCNPCEVLTEGKLTTVTALDGHESLVLNGITFEAAYTSGGIGSLAESWEGKAREVNYKTLRYPGHFDFMRVLRDDLQLAHHKQVAEQWFTRALPYTSDDIVAINISVMGVNNGSGAIFRRSTRSYTQIIPAQGGHTAIQLTTAHGVLAVVDAYLQGAFTTTGFVRQEEIPYDAIVASPFSAVYQLPHFPNPK